MSCVTELMSRATSLPFKCWEVLIWLATQALDSRVELELECVHTAQDLGLNYGGEYEMGILSRRM
jgi:hypothetical protein